MRKYHQLLLLIISVLSLSLLLIYRHEYNRLHYVLEVFNFFGQPCNLSDLTESNNIVNHHDWGPTPVWSIDGDLNYYSSFWLHSNEASTLVSRPQKADHAKTCYLWYEDKPEAVIGKYKYAKIKTDGTTEAYIYYCGSNKGDTPYAVSYTRNNKKSMRKLQLHTKKPGVVFNTTVCVAPTVQLTKSSFVEFVSFHALIGVDSFIIYTNDLPYRVIKIVTNLSNRLNIKITFNPWNMASSNLSFTFVENDCTLRALEKSKFVTTLSVNEYIVPSSQETLFDIFGRFDTDRLSLAVQKFCLDHSSPHKPIALQNTRSLQDSDKAVRVVYKNSREDNVISAQGLDKDSICVHRYIYCKDGAQKSYEDNSMAKYTTDFTRSTLVQLLLHKQL